MIGLYLALLLSAPTARNPAVVKHYRATHSCPEYIKDAKGRTVSCALYKKVVNKKQGVHMEVYWPCGGCDVDHLCPLACGGKDAPENLHWMDSRANRSKGADCGDCK